MVFIRKPAFMALACLGIGALSACVTDGVTRDIELTYVPPETPAVSGEDGGIIYLRDFEDPRFEKEDVGDVRNPNGDKVFDVILTNNASEALTSAVQQALERAGYIVERLSDGAAPAGAPELSGKITIIQCCDEAGFSELHSSLALEATLVQNQATLMDQAFVGKGAERAFLLDSEVYQASLSKALGDAVAKLVDQVESTPL